MAITPNVQSLYDGALQIIQEHNQNLAEEVSPSTPGYVDPDKFVQCIKTSGGTSEDRLRKFRWEDILNCLPETNGVKPTILAKEIAALFRGNSESKTESVEPRPVSKSKASKMTLRELVEHYDPAEPNSVAKRLDEISRGEPFVVFSDGRQVNIDATFKLLQEVKDGYPGRDIYEGKKVHVVGFIPDNDVDENPIYRGRPLRPDGTCDQLNRSWDGIPKDVRQFIAFALNHPSGPDVRGDRDKAWELFDLALAGMRELRKRYANVAVDFDEAAKRNELPHLLISLGQPALERKKKPWTRG